MGGKSHPVTDTDVGQFIRMTARAVTQTYNLALRDTGLRSTQFSLLAALAEHDSVPIGQLSEAMGMDHTTMGRNIRPLLRAGYVEISFGDDRRVREMRITASGLNAFQEALPAWRVAQTEIEKALGAERWSGLRRDLAILTKFARDLHASHR